MGLGIRIIDFHISIFFPFTLLLLFDSAHTIAGEKACGIIIFLNKRTGSIGQSSNNNHRKNLLILLP